MASTTNDFLTVTEAGCLKSGCQHIWALVRTLSSFAEGHLLDLSSHDKRKGGGGMGETK